MTIPCWTLTSVQKASKPRRQNEHGGKASSKATRKREMTAIREHDRTRTTLTSSEPGGALGPCNGASLFVEDNTNNEQATTRRQDDAAPSKARCAEHTADAIGRHENGTSDQTGDSNHWLRWVHRRSPCHGNQTTAFCRDHINRIEQPNIRTAISKLMSMSCERHRN